MVAANMEVVPSIYNALVKLKEEGYTVENLPDSADELWEMINTQGSVLGPYAKGAFDDFLEKGNPAMIETSKYEQWVAKDLEEKRYQQVIEKYGKAPGEYLSSRSGGKDYIAVARLQFGNIVLLPQPLAGLGEDTFRIIHGTESAPHIHTLPLTFGPETNFRQMLSYIGVPMEVWNLLPASRWPCQDMIGQMHLSVFHHIFMFIPSVMLEKGL